MEIRPTDGVFEVTALAGEPPAGLLQTVDLRHFVAPSFDISETAGV